MDSRCSTYHRTCWTSSTDFAADTPKKTSAAPLPFAISHGTLIPMGFSSTLDDALSRNVEHAINMIAAMFEMPRQQVYLLLSAAIDFNVTQVVDITPKAFTI